MKRLFFILLLCSPIILPGQNWQSVRMNDTTFYTIPAASDYLRVIWIDSATVQGIDSIFHFYPSIRLVNTNTNCLDTIGPTWLGKIFIKHSNGDEHYFNRWLDTILLKPRSAINSTWTLHTDTSGNEFRASITSLDTMTIDNQLDSVKELTIQVFNNNMIVSSHIHNNKKMVLSKNHGLVECLEWYGFPYTINDQDGYFSNHIYLTTAKNHQRVSKIKSGLDLTPEWNRIYQSGNVWQYITEYESDCSSSSYCQKKCTYYESNKVISSNQYATNKLAVEIEWCWHSVCTTNIAGSGQPPQFQTSNSKNSGTTKDTIDLSKSYGRMYDIAPSEAKLDVYNLNNYHKEYYLSHDSSGLDGYSVQETRKPIGFNYLNCFTYHGAISYEEYSTSHLVPFGISGVYSYTTNGLTLRYTRSDKVLSYLKIDSVGFGAYIDCLSLNTKDQNLSNYIVYPNPVSDILYIQLKNEYQKCQTNLINTQGQIVLHCNNCLKLDVSTIPPGVYALRLITENNIVTKKVVVQR